MADDRWRTWDEIEAEAKKAGRLDEARVAAHRERMRAEQRAYRLAEIRKQQGLTQTDVAAAMHVSQRRVSAVERGDLSRTELGTVASYVEAIGGKVEIVADFGDERVVIGLRAAGTKHRHVRYPRMARRINRPRWHRRGNPLVRYPRRASSSLGNRRWSVGGMPRATAAPLVQI